MKSIKFLVIGGDERSFKLAEQIHNDGFDVKTYANREEELSCSNSDSKTLKEIISETDIVIGPVPLTHDDENLYAPEYKEKLPISSIFKNMKKNQVFIAGRIVKKVHEMASKYNVFCIDLLEREEMAVLNAIPTAEGAIQIAMEEMPITLHGSNALIVGYGRIGKVLSKMLLGLGANVFVAARKCEDHAWIKAMGYTPVALNEMFKSVKTMDVIFNTVPVHIIDEKTLKNVEKKCLIIDLASKPGGFDHIFAGQIGLNVVWALSLPGKVAPVTAAKAIKETVYNILGELPC